MWCECEYVGVDWVVCSFYFYIEWLGGGGICNCVY